MLRKISVITVTLFFILLLAVVNISKRRVIENTSEAAPLPENHLHLEDVSLVQVLGLNGGYITMSAKSAYFDHNIDLLTMVDAEFEMNKPDVRMTSHADQGIYKLNEMLTTEGNISGVWNDLEYKADENGTFMYDFEKDQAYMGKKLTFVKGNSQIFTKELHYDGEKQETFFSGGVYMVINERELK